jgi:hypothetical protein
MAALAGRVVEDRNGRPQPGLAAKAFRALRRPGRVLSVGCVDPPHSYPRLAKIRGQGHWGHDAREIIQIITALEVLLALCIHFQVSTVPYQLNLGLLL